MRQAAASSRAARLSLRVDPRSKVPAYVQIAEQVDALVAAGALRTGDRLPTVRRAAGEARVNFNTVARAYRVLDAAGLVSTQRGRGTFVVGRRPSARSQRARLAALDILVGELLQSAERLGCRPAQVRAAVERGVRRVADRPIGAA